MESGERGRTGRQKGESNWTGEERRVSLITMCDTLNYRELHRATFTSISSPLAELRTSSST